MPSARSSMLDRAPSQERNRTSEATAGGISRRRLYAKRGARLRLDGARAGDRALAIGRQRRLGQSAVPAGPISDRGRDLQARDVSGALWQHVSASVVRIGSGWVLGTVAGVIIGFAIGLSTLARGVGITFISALFPIPKIALLPLLIPLARDRRGAEDRDHCARRVLLHCDLGL